MYLIRERYYIDYLCRLSILEKKIIAHYDILVYQVIALIGFWENARLNFLNLKVYNQYWSSLSQVTRLKQCRFELTVSTTDSV